MGGGRAVFRAKRGRRASDSMLSTTRNEGSEMPILLGCIADDFTGATDLANTLVKQGMRTVQVLGVPESPLDFGAVDAVVVALKSRTASVADAVADSVAALGWLEAQGAQQFFFKYCSTFDSTDEGNIGPVADALLDRLGDGFTIACPAFPATGRSLYKGYLFVGDELLSESSMRDHPLTPMRDPNLVRVLSPQTAHPVGLVGHATVTQGAAAIRSAFDALRNAGTGYAIVDAITDADLMAIGEACADLKLVTGGSGVAMGLPANLLRQSDGHPTPPSLPAVDGGSAVIAGSCSRATRGQVARAKADWPSFSVDPVAIAAGEDVAAAALAWADEQGSGRPLLYYSSAEPEQVAEIQARFGRQEAGELVEQTFGRIAEGLLQRGVGRLIVAGGETSGAVVQALNIRALRIGPEIDPGVPWTESLGGPRLALALKSGNFGGEDFFDKALGMLP